MDIRESKKFEEKEKKKLNLTNNNTQNAYDGDVRDLLRDDSPVGTSSSGLTRDEVVDNIVEELLRDG